MRKEGVMEEITEITEMVGHIIQASCSAEWLNHAMLILDLWYHCVEWIQTTTSTVCMGWECTLVPKCTDSEECISCDICYQFVQLSAQHILSLHHWVSKMPCSSVGSSLRPAEHLCCVKSVLNPMNLAEGEVVGSECMVSTSSNPSLARRLYHLYLQIRLAWAATIQHDDSSAKHKQVHSALQSNNTPRALLIEKNKLIVTTIPGLYLFFVVIVWDGVL